MKLSRKNVAALSGEYHYAISRYEPTTAHEHLLHQHAIEMQAYLQRLLMRSHNRFTLTVSGTTALAFCQFWAEQTTEPYATTIIYKVSAAIDQYRKSPRRLISEIL